MVNYFLISVSNKQNLLLCKKYALAGFTNSLNGVWTFCEINEGDFISFLYAAKVHNLYRVEKKVAFENAHKLGPWEPITFTISRKTYYFPFRLFLKPLRKFEESLVRPEFSYIAENLLIRGGYRKTHFQADQTTLQSVSQMGKLFPSVNVEKLEIKEKTFIPRFTVDKEKINIPYIFPFREVILQSLIRHYLSNLRNLKKFLNDVNVDKLKPSRLEVLSEKALPEGHIDLLIKEAIPLGESKSIIIEVKTGKVRRKDFQQLYKYMQEFGPECLKAVLIGKDFSKKAIKEFEGIITPIVYEIETPKTPLTFGQLLETLELVKY